MAKKDNKKKSGKNTPASKETTPSSSVPDLSKLKINSDRTATGVRTSTDRSRDFSFEQFSLNLCGRNLIQNTTLELNYGNRYGLVSENGAGKTTLLQCIAARDIDIPEHIDIHLLAEEAEKTDMSAIEYVIHHAQQQLEKLETELEDAIAEDPDDPLVEDLLERIEQMDSATFEPRAAMILSGLGFAPERQTQMTKDMSGGWRMRVALAKALFIKPTLLLLDQPSNHLDLPAVIWLEEYLAKYDRMLLMVSHSEDLLNAVCSHIIHLSPKKTLDYYGGNYDVFVRTKEENEVNQMKAYEKQQAEIAHIKAFAAAAGTYSNLVKQAQSKLKIVEKMEAAGLVEKVEAARQIKFNFTNAGKLPPPVLAFDDVSFAYSGKMEDCLYNDLELGIDCDSRIALVGPNGAGKSTLFKLITGELQPTAGRIQTHSHLKLAMFSQHSTDQLDMDISPIEYIRRKFKDKHGTDDFEHWRRQVGRYGITGAHQLLAIKHLSDGLRARLVFCELALTSPHILLLDEPTNALSMEMIDALACAINEYDGGVVVISHDFALLRQINADVWVCDQGTITRWDGGIDSYKKWLRKQILDSMNASAR